MAQLTDDCFAFGAKLQTLDAALALIAAQIACAVPATRVPLADADGRILAEDLRAEIDLPPFANAAVDGYAVRHADLPAPPADPVLPISGRLAAGHEPRPLTPGTAQRIFTGAVLPPGADTVFMQEDVTLEPAGIRLPQGLPQGANTRPAGEDVARGARALPAGRRLRPQDLALAAALGRTHLDVREPLRVALFSTGDELVDPVDELVDPGHRPGPAQRYDSNRILLAALCRRAGAHVTDLGILPDDVGAIAAALARAAPAHHAILTTGGVSAGEEDHVRAAVERAGRLAWWRLAIKPGRPVAMGQIGDTPFMGLPGNPAAAFVTFTQLARPMLAALAGQTYRPPTPLPVPVGFAHRKKADRREYLRVRLEHGVAHRHPVEGAGILASLTETDGMLVLPDDVRTIAPGDTLPFLSYAALL